MRRRDVLTGAAALAFAGVAEANASPLDGVLARWDADEHPDLKGVVVRIDGQVAAERAYFGADLDALHDMRSAGKSVTSLLAGAAVDRGLIRSVADPVSRYWPEAKGSPVGDVTLADILTMRSGLAANDEDAASPGNEDRLDEASDTEAFLLATPRMEPPGSRYQYNSLTAFVAGLVVEKAAERHGVAFAREVLFDPLGIKRFEWASDVSGHAKGQGNLSLSPRSMAIVGQMALDRGAWKGQQVISRSWIDESLAPKVGIAAVDRYADGYGYFWYAKTHDIGGRPVEVRFASGNGGNKIYVIPSRRMVVAIASAAYGKGYGQRRSEAILKALLA